MDTFPDRDPRAAAQQRLETMVGRGELTLGEFSDLAGRIWAAETSQEIERVLGSLPVPGPPEPARQPASGGRPRSSWTIFGDVRRSGRWDLTAGFRADVLFGDVRLDLRDAVVDAAVTTIEVRHYFGDVKVIVPPGVDVELSGTTHFGDERLDLGDGSVDPGAPRVVLHTEGLFGDVKVKALPKGVKPGLGWRIG